MFNSDFYPTPENVIQSMGFDPTDKIILEPSAGKGDIVDYCYKNGAKKVIAFENDDNLREILKSKTLVIGDDFLSAIPHQLSHIDMIVMNPPFSCADKHILKAWEVAPDGCEIFALCNYETIAKDYRYSELSALIKNYGVSENLGNCFSNAERKTNVEVGLIKLVKPSSSDENYYSGFFMDEDEEELAGEGIMAYNEVRALVNRYVGTLKIFNQLDENLASLNYMTKQVGMSKLSITVGYKDTVQDKDDFLKKLQKESWKHIFDKMNLNKYVTSGVMKNINKFVETQQQVPFTMKNIYHMINIIVGTRQENLEKALIEAVDNFTQYTHENRFGVEGWKTNSGHMLNKKFIVEGIMETQSFMGFNIRYDSYGGEKINDLVKVLCNLTGNNYDEMSSLYRFNYNKFNDKMFNIEPNTWYSWDFQKIIGKDKEAYIETKPGFFDVKFFKKGTMHLKFKRVEDWYILNSSYGKLKGFVLPETYKK